MGAGIDQCPVAVGRRKAEPRTVMLGSAGFPSAGGTPGRQPPGRGLGDRYPEGLRQGPTSHWCLLSCHWMEGLQPPPWRLGQRSKMEGSRGTHRVGQAKVTQVEQRDRGNEEEEGVWGSFLAWVMDSGRDPVGGGGEVGEVTGWGGALPRLVWGTL